MDKQSGYFVTIKHSYSTKKTQYYTNEEKHPKVKSSSKDFGCKSSEFRFLQPVALRSCRKFFLIPFKGPVPNCDNAANNFNYNLWYFQMNYTVLLALTVLIAMKWIDFHPFNLEVYFTLTLLGLLYVLNSLGLHVKALGRKVKISEQFAVIIALMVLYNGFLPAAFDFIYFFGGYVIVVVIHASINKVGSFYHANNPVYHI